jgi:hypothetical protein
MMDDQTPDYFKDNWRWVRGSMICWGICCGVILLCFYGLPRILPKDRAPDDLIPCMLGLILFCCLLASHGGIYLSTFFIWRQTRFPMTTRIRQLTYGLACIITLIALSWLVLTIKVLHFMFTFRM